MLLLIFLVENKESVDEILRNVIAERVLGLPQDPRADKGLAFKDIPTKA